jgi:hypothetical protein
MASRASVRTISGFSGVNPPKDFIDLKCQDEVHVGSVVTGSVRMLGQAPIKTVHLVLEGIEYSVVALAKDANKTRGLDYLRKNTSETRTVTKQEMLLDCAQAQTFSFSLAENLPSTIKYLMEGSNPTLPSQCQIIYTISATIYGNSSKTKVTNNLLVLPSKIEPTIPVDPSVYVSVGFALDFFLRPFLSCGETQPTGEKYLVLTPNLSSLRLAAGQLVKLKVRDLLGLLASPQEIWMLRLVEKITWKAKGREETLQQSWDLFANTDEIPANVKRTYDQDPKGLLKVSHELVVYVVTNGSPTGGPSEASTPIPVQIVSGGQA